MDYGHDEHGRLQEMSSGEWTAKWLRDSVGLEAERHLTGGVHITTRRDKFGRETFKSVGARNVEQFRRRYTWDMGNRLLVARDEITGRVARYDYDEFDNLISAEYERGGEVERLYRVPDRMGNLFETHERDDRRYDAGGRLAEDREFFYHYDCEGNLVFKEFKEMALRGGIIAPINKGRLEAELGIRFRAFGTGWRYDWQSDGMLARVVRPDGKEVSFAYDALGRRIRKSFAGTATHFVWDGNIPLHEWTEEAGDSMVTWLFEQDTFVPAAKLVANGDCFSIVSDYLGTPMQAYDKQGNKVWEQELDIYGRQRKRPSAFIPFKYQGQYDDAETGLYYNRFRYYDPNAGSYISQDPIGLKGGNPTLYGYVGNTNNWYDIWGLRPFGHAVGDIGENAVINDLKKNGYEIIDVKYGSNNGIDVLAKNPKTGKYDAFEVKSSTVGNFNLSDAQMKPDEFVKTRLNNAAANGKINKKTRREIMTNLGERKIAYVDIKRGDKGKLYADTIRYENWDAETERIEKLKKGGHH